VLVNLARPSSFFSPISALRSVAPSHGCDWADASVFHVRRWTGFAALSLAVIWIFCASSAHAASQVVPDEPVSTAPLGNVEESISSALAVFDTAESAPNLAFFTQSDGSTGGDRLVQGASFQDDGSDDAASSNDDSADAGEIAPFHLSLTGGLAPVAQLAREFIADHSAWIARRLVRPP
jgi:hypothetical protein